MLDYIETIPSAGTTLPHGLIELGAGHGDTTYQIHFHDRKGTLIAAHTVRCDGDKQAAILAHALRPATARSFEVWRDAYLVYERPYLRASAAPNARPPILCHEQRASRWLPATRETAAATP